MKKSLLLAMLPLTAFAQTGEVQSEPQPLTAAQVQMVQTANTYTYVRCWYRPSQSHDDPATEWEWALDANGDYYKLNGYWWSSWSFKNMFYTSTPQSEIQQRCEDTLNVTHDTADILFFAADNRLSYNHTIWSNDQGSANAINKVVAFGDSLSDTGNLFNASQWVFPNRNSWFLGHFSNGLVWTEYLSNSLNLPLYNWAVGGAAGSNQYVALTGVTEQVTSYLEYMQLAQNYNPANTLFTLEFGLNDFMNYNRSVPDVKADYSSAMQRLVASGAKNVLLMTLPDATRAPQFKYSSQEEIEKVRAKILEFNEFIKEEAQRYQDQGINLVLFDTHSLFQQITTKPEEHGFANAKDACLDINRSSAQDYLYSHSFTDECAYHGSDKYVFWGVTHPTTATHNYIATQMYPPVIATFNIQP
ncbi:MULTISPECIES: SGNH/GDSL hydrolase family protein [unclassified Vibrio]|uniref:SGNH/GDSL hydrolase family protein n=1 Tax=unclassified Vibrio TaxID=2614977 RepID=UPI001361F208|nr:MULTISPECIES: SGNH/GDSL hydrolase family protein [unclassified Vibrio]NAW60038.1 thermolabile hemolysin [Vibrio sp. V36_P2S2PM302]NAX26763.1 thermolabile hemolysin [Vibrio sp. V38_P2S17PM301]NAX29877.1 thermolabile hemolysin [Vibrio sp. V37_P2S8PM304]